jgi:hypothetical protein
MASCIIVGFGFCERNSSLVVSSAFHVRPAFLMCVASYTKSFPSSLRLCSAPLSSVLFALASLFPGEDLWSTGSGSDESTIVHSTLVVTVEVEVGCLVSVMGSRL